VDSPKTNPRAGFHLVSRFENSDYRGIREAPIGGFTIDQVTRRFRTLRTGVPRQGQRGDETWMIVAQGKGTVVQPGHGFNDTETEPDAVGLHTTVTPIEAFGDS
jgi:hypothetical protein